ncbi:hypothetical protein DX912_06985 [Lysobacter soli]|uniref:DUF1850 domain-containing protein n=1 Tax=Lysobacter soli TaxID=453783 RepID=A0A3D8VHN9_9GAMM|nr:hypothetical protein [Lysobacter soli]RDY68338.1 hypothetical protein DX912_06985 [Lysobacter soli]
MKRLLASVGVVALLSAPSVKAVSFGIDAHPIVYEERGRVCFRVERYVYSHSIISFLDWYRDIEARDVRLVDLLVGNDEDGWGVYKDESTPGLRLRRSTGVCYGLAPAGFVTRDEAEPLRPGRYTVLMDAREGENHLRFTDDFCLSDDRRLVKCDDGEEAPKSFIEQLLRWVFGD